MIEDNKNNEDEIFMEELKQEFIKTVSKNLVELQSLINENKFEEITRIAHDIKGMSGAFEMEEGSEIANELQSAAQENGIEKTKVLIDQLTAYMKENGVPI